MALISGQHQYTARIQRRHESYQSNYAKREQYLGSLHGNQLALAVRRVCRLDLRRRLPRRFMAQAAPTSLVLKTSILTRWIFVRMEGTCATSNAICSFRAPSTDPVSNAATVEFAVVAVAVAFTLRACIPLQPSKCATIVLQ